MSLSEHDRHQLSNLASAAADGSITPEQHAWLESWLESNADARAFYVRFIDISAGLAWASRDALEPASQNHAFPAQVTLLGLRRSWMAAAGAAAVLAIAAVGIWAMLRPQATTLASRPVGIATLSTAVNVEWTESKEPDHVGNLLKPGWLRLKSGMAQIDFLNGSSVWLEGPVEFRLDSSREAFCASGKLVAAVPSGAGSLLISTPYMTVLDRGTGCGMDVSKGSRATVHVFRGTVDVTAQVSQTKTSVGEGQAMAVDHAGSTSFASADPNAFNREEFEASNWGNGYDGRYRGGYFGPPPSSFGAASASFGGNSPYVHNMPSMPSVFDGQWKGADPLDVIREQLKTDMSRWQVIRKPLESFLLAQGESWGWGPPDKGVSQASWALWAMTSNPETSEDEIAKQLQALRAARNDARHNVEVATSKLRAILTPFEESKLVSLGYLP